MLCIGIARKIEQITLRRRIVGSVEVVCVGSENSVHRPHIGSQQQIALGIGVEFLPCSGEQRTSVERILANWTMAQQVVESGRNVSQRRQPGIVIKNMIAQVRGQMDDQRNAHDLGPYRCRMAGPPKLAGSVAMVAGNDDDAVVVESALLQVIEELTKAGVDPVDFIGDTSLKTRAVGQCCDLGDGTPLRAN